MWGQRKRYGRCCAPVGSGVQEKATNQHQNAQRPGRYAFRPPKPRPGETLDEAIEAMRGAIESHLLALQAGGMEIPADQAIWVETITVESPTAA